MIYVTGDTHGEIGRFINEKEPIYRTLTEKDTLIICGDFGFVWYEADKKDRWQEAYLETLSKLPFQTLFVDGNHENFNALNDYPVEMWNGGKVHIIKKNAFGEPKVIHLMRGQIFLIDGKKIFTFGGGNSIDKDSRVLL